jgi:HAD superfamily hydrolase (TIGR01549 family)
MLTMIKAVLLDLDDTLLINPDATFVTEYLGRVDSFFTDCWGQPLARTLLKTLHAMNGKRDMCLTNAEVALDVIHDETGRASQDIQDTFQQFYQDVFPQLRSCTQTIPAAAGLVSYLTERNCALVIATNPLYPAAAVYQRLAWAGLPDNPESYALVTHSENMHFTKNSAAYYAEIVARVGVEPDEAIMVGDNPANDISPARKAGLSTFHVSSEAPLAADIPTGTLSDFYRRVTQEDWLDAITPPVITPDMVMPELTGNVGALFGMLADVKPHFWEQHPDPEEWSPIQVVCHLLESESRVQRPRLERIAQEHNPFLASPQPPAGPHDALTCDPNGQKAALRFAQERQKTLDFVRILQPDDWKRPARHSIFGPTTLLEMAHFTAQHDRLHINQLCQTLGRCE